MAKILVFQHVPHEPLGTLDPLIRSYRHRIRYINFHRNPHIRPNIGGYDALILLGGPMNIGQEADYPHLQIEKEIILEAATRNLPILGICLGAQLIASAFGAQVYPAECKEIGWKQLSPTGVGKKDPLISAFSGQERVFQWHENTFDLPPQAELLVCGQQVPHQAFRIGKHIYGFQFHLEANLPLIKRWLKLPQHLQEIAALQPALQAEELWQDSMQAISRAQDLSHQVFEQFLELVPKVRTQFHFKHRRFTAASPITNFA